jgi:hypothetical protein
MKTMRPSNSEHTPKPEPGCYIDVTRLRDRFADLVLYNQELTSRAKSLPYEVQRSLAEFFVRELHAGFSSQPTANVLHFPWPPLAGDPLASHMEALRFEDGGQHLVVLRPAVPLGATRHLGADLTKAARARGMSEAVVVSFELFGEIDRWAGGKRIETFTRLLDALAYARRIKEEEGPLRLHLPIYGSAQGKPHTVACEFVRLVDGPGQVTLLGRLAGCRLTPQQGNRED